MAPEIPNSKDQIPNKSQAPKSEKEVWVIWELKFGACLEFGA
jgi:hypothetical protein